MPVEGTGPWQVVLDNALVDLMATVARTTTPEERSGKWCFILAVEALEKAIAERPFNDAVQSHFYFPTTWIASSGYPEDADRCLAVGFTHAINLCHERDYGESAKGRLKYLNLGTLADDGTPRPLEYWKAMADFFLPDYQADNNCKVLVNCAAGASRSPSGVYFLLRAITKMGPVEAKATVYAANLLYGRNINLTYAPSADAALLELGLI